MKSFPYKRSLMVVLTAVVLVVGGLGNVFADDAGDALEKVIDSAKPAVAEAAASSNPIAPEAGPAGVPPQNVVVRDLYFASVAVSSATPATPTPTPATGTTLTVITTGAQVTTANLGLKYKIMLWDVNKTPPELRQVHDWRWFYGGGKIRFVFEPNTDGYLYVFMKGSSGSWSQLFPDSRISSGNNFLQAHKEYAVPFNDYFAFDAKKGKEEMHVYFSSKPIQQFVKLETQPASTNQVVILSDAAVKQVITVARDLANNGRDLLVHYDSGSTATPVPGSVTVVSGQAVYLVQPGTTQVLYKKIELNHH
jgi:hypothetical protein